MNDALISAASLKKQLENEDFLVLDVRATELFIDGFIPGALSAGTTGKYDKWLLEQLGAGRTVVLVSNAGDEQATWERFQTLYPTEKLLVLGGGFPAWVKAGSPKDLIIEVEADELALDLPHDPSMQVIDLRGKEEFEAAHVTRAQHIPLAELVDLATIANFEEDQQLYLHCGGGQQSVLAASLMKQQGVHNLRVVAGGFDAIQQEKAISITQQPDHSGSQK